MAEPDIIRKILSAVRKSRGIRLRGLAGVCARACDWLWVVFRLSNVYQCAHSVFCLARTVLYHRWFLSPRCS